MFQKVSQPSVQYYRFGLQTGVVPCSLADVSSKKFDTSQLLEILIKW